MKTLRILKTLLVASSALVLTSCGADEVASPGEGTFEPAPGSGGGGGGVVVPPPGTPAADCPTGFGDLGTVAGGTLRNCQLPNTIVGDFTVPARAGTVYSFSGRVDVGADRGGDAANPTAAAQGILRIQPGVKLFGSGALDFIVVYRGSQIFAVGTPTQPIVFTSRASVDGGVDMTNEIGKWGGIVILGRAPISNCGGAPYRSATCQAIAEGTTSAYGGNSENDNSGSLQYVRVQHAGYEVSPGRELNGITLAGVGSGTLIDYVQVHNSSDDGIEFFGGAVNAKHLVLTGNDDDSLDTDDGYNGVLQYVIAMQRPGGGNRIVEASMASLATGNPKSRPVLANFTFVGTAAAAADTVLMLNTGTDFRFYNGVVTTPKTTLPTSCLDIDNTPDTNAVFRSVFMSCANPFTSVSDTDTIEESVIFGAGSGNTSAGANTLTNGFVNGANETAVAPVTFSSIAISELPAATRSLLTQTDYIGAVKNASDTWYANWTCGLPGGTAC